MTANDKKSYLPYFNKLVDQCNSIYHYYINRNPINTYYSTSIENLDTNSKAPNCKVKDRVGSTIYNNIFSKVCIENWSQNIYYSFCFENLSLNL